MIWGINVANPTFIYGFIILPLLLVLYFLMLRWKRKAFERFGERDVIAKLFPDYSPGRQLLKFILIMSAFVFLVIAMIDPRIGSKLGTSKHKGADLIIALDISKSMLAEDIKPNRLIRAKQALGKFTEKLDGYKIGVVVFAGRAYPRLPLTPDMSAAKSMLESAEADNIPAQGTAIGEAIEMSVRALSTSKSKDKAIILVSDGENHEDDAVSAAKFAAQNNVKVFALGVGLPAGGPIPVYKNGVRHDFKRDRSGNTVISRLNEELLGMVAAAGEGSYVRANNIQEGLDEVLKEIKKLEGDEYEASWFVEYEDRYQYFLAFVILFIVLEQFLSSKKGLIERINIFSE